MRYFSAEYFSQLWNIASQYILNNYDYCYLSAMHTKNRVTGAKTIIAGMSYTRNGIVDANLADTINFSSSSQDLYYSFQHIKKAVDEGKQKIETCIINIGYYSLYWDLSYSKHESWKIKSTHYPILGKAHHCSIEGVYDRWENVVYDKNIFKGNWLREFACEWAENFFQEESTYYGSLKTRESDSGLGKIWNALPEDVRRKVAALRTYDHHRLKVHEHTRQENADLLKEITEYLFQRQITPVFLIMPFTTYYNELINKEYKEDILSLLEELPYPVEFLDMNDYLDMFDNNFDFLDDEHLSLQGALRATDLLSEFLNLIADEK